MIALIFYGAGWALSVFCLAYIFFPDTESNEKLVVSILVGVVSFAWPLLLIASFMTFLALWARERIEA